MFNNNKLYWGIAIFLAAGFVVCVIELVYPGAIIPSPREWVR